VQVHFKGKHYGHSDGEIPVRGVGCCHEDKFGDIGQLAFSSPSDDFESNDAKYLKEVS
jgi:hypothetical protein